MKNVILPTLAFAIVSSATAKTFTMKVKSVTWAAESMAVEIIGTNGQHIAYLDGTSRQTLNTLEKAAKQKTCVKITELSNSAVKAVSVKCPAKLPKIKSYY